MRLIDVNNESLASTDFALHRRSSILGFRATLTNTNQPVEYIADFEKKSIHFETLFFHHH